MAALLAGAAVPISTAGGPPGPPGTEVRQVANKGFGLFATAPQQQGALVFSEEPIFVMQHTGNRRVVAACANCQAVVGGFASQLEALFNEPRFAPLVQELSPLVQRWQADLGATPPVRCAHGCGEIYCSEACRDAAFRHSHNLLCTGPIGTEDHPLLRFKYHALEHADTLLLAAQVMAHLINRAQALGGGAQVVRGLMQELFAFCHAPFRDACRGIPGRGKDADFLAHTDGLIQKGAELLGAALMERAPAEAAALFEGGPALFSELLGLFEYNNIDVEVPSPLGPLLTGRGKALLAAVRSGGASPETAAAVEELKLLEKLLREKEWVMACTWGEETTGNFAPDSEADAGTMGEDDAAMAANDDAEGHNPAVASAAMTRARAQVEQMSIEQLLEAPWPALHGTALFGSVARMNHSCEPNCKIDFPCNSARLVSTALAPIAPNDELCISYIKCDVDVKARRRNLLEYGFVCSCPRCLREDSGEIRKTQKRLK